MRRARRSPSPLPMPKTSDRSARPLPMKGELGDPSARTSGQREASGCMAGDVAVFASWSDENVVEPSYADADDDHRPHRRSLAVRRLIRWGTSMAESGERLRVAIACQGGGSHTAFTAGVLQRVFGSAEMGRYEIVGLSGTSGGAVCALLAWSALCHGDVEQVGSRLQRFW